MGSKWFSRHTCSLWKKNPTDNSQMLPWASSQAFHWNRQHKSHAHWFGQKFIDLCFVFGSKAVKTENPSKDIPDVATQLTFSVTRFVFGCLRASWVRWSPMGLSACCVCCNLCDGHGACMDPALQLWKKSRWVEPLGAGAAVPRSCRAPCLRSVESSAQGAEFLPFCKSCDCINIQRALDRLFKR